MSSWSCFGWAEYVGSWFLFSGVGSLLVFFGVSICRKGFMEDIHDNASDGLKVVARQRKGENIQKCNVQSGDGAKYMSYIKVIC